MPANGAEEDYDTLRYEDPEVPYFWTIPDGFDDRYLNVRFTPPYAPFYLMEAHIPLFDVFGEQGTPDMKVVVYYSGELDGEEGYPVEAVDSIVVEFDDLVFGGEDPVINVINLRDMRFGANDVIDFHIAVDLVADSTNDTLAIYFDDGESGRPTRSGIWDGQLEQWNKLDQVDGIELPYNFFIHAVISPNPEVGVKDILRPSGPPERLRLTPVYPNPFNNVTSVQFFVRDGVPYQLRLMNPLGQVSRLLEAGLGRGERYIAVNGLDLSSGTYFIVLSSPDGTVGRKVELIK